jgi:GNAT superfamily N-acetyltransferase
MSSHEPLDAHMTRTARTASGTPVTLRPLRHDDAAALGDYLTGLSDATRSFWGPHGFSRETACEICSGLAADRVLRLIATMDVDGKERIVAYFLLYRGARAPDAGRYAARGIWLDDATDAALAPSVADAFQNQGIGGILMAHTLEVARRLGRSRVVLWDGVQARNARGIHFYTKWGFRCVGEFTTRVLNYDMILELEP